MVSLPQEEEYCYGKENDGDCTTNIWHNLKGNPLRLFDFLYIEQSTFAGITNVLSIRFS